MSGARLSLLCPLSYSIFTASCRHFTNDETEAQRGSLAHSHVASDRVKVRICLTLSTQPPACWHVGFLQLGSHVTSMWCRIGTPLMDKIRTKFGSSFRVSIVAHWEFPGQELEDSPSIGRPVDCLLPLRWGLTALFVLAVCDILALLKTMNYSDSGTDNQQPAFIYLFYLAVPGFSCSVWDRGNSSFWYVGSSSLTRDWTWGPCRGHGVLATGPPGKSHN